MTESENSERNGEGERERRRRTERKALLHTYFFPSKKYIPAVYGQQRFTHITRIITASLLLT